MIFNIRYLTNEKNNPKRLWHSGASDSSYFSYLIRNKNSLSENEKNIYTSLFDFDGLLTKKEVKEKKKKTQETDAVIYTGFISFNMQENEFFSHHRYAIYYMNSVFKTFLKISGFNPKKIDILATLHLDTDFPHIHFQFYELEPTKIIYNGKTKTLEKRYKVGFTKKELKLMHILNKIFFKENDSFLINDNYKKINKIFADYGEEKELKIILKDIVQNIELLKDIKTEEERKNKLEYIETLKETYTKTLLNTNKILKRISNNYNGIFKEELKKDIITHLEGILNTLNIFKKFSKQDNKVSYRKKVIAKQNRDNREKQLLKAQEMIVKKYLKKEEDYQKNNIIQEEKIIFY